MLGPQGSPCISEATDGVFRCEPEPEWVSLWVEYWPLGRRPGEHQRLEYRGGGSSLGVTIIRRGVMWREKTPGSWIGMEEEE